jgi:DNA polymerase delta subunit 1
MLLRKCRTSGLLIPNLAKNRQDESTYEGATVRPAPLSLSVVSFFLPSPLPPFPPSHPNKRPSTKQVIEPKKAFYQEPIATLDFASLYPSIMQASKSARPPACTCTARPRRPA